MTDLYSDTAAQEALVQWLLSDANGYRSARLLPDGSVAAVIELMFTRAIILGCSRNGYDRRFCFEDKALADQRFAELQTEDDVPAGWTARR